MRTWGTVATSVADSVDLEFDKPVDVSGYLSAMLVSDGAKQVDAEVFNNATLL